MDAFAHIVERFIIHFVGATFALLAFFFALRYWLRRNRKVAAFLSPDINHLLVTSALLVFALFTLREPFDVASGQVWYKAIFDQISWFAGAAVSAFGLYRFRKEL